MPLLSQQIKSKSIKDTLVLMHSQEQRQQEGTGENITTNFKFARNFTPLLQENI